MSNNGKVQPSHLDKLLENKPPEFQVKVMRFAMDSGMRPEDPAFRLVQYIGYLAQLTETAPTEWQQLFQKLQGELEEWTILTAEQLTTTADQSETINNLAQSCDRLGVALSALDLTSQQQLEQLKILSEISPNLRSVASEIPTLKKLLTNLNQALSQKQVLKMELNQVQMYELRREILTASGNRELTLLQGRMEDLLQNQRWLIQKIEKLSKKESQKSENKGILLRTWEGIKNAILNWICNVDWWFSLGGFMMCLLVLCLGLAIITRVIFQVAPPPLPFYAQQEIHQTQKQTEKTKELVGYMYVKLQRMEKFLGSNR